MKELSNKMWNDFRSQNTGGDVHDIAQGLVTTLIILISKSQIEAFKNSSTYQKLKIDYYNLLHQHTDLRISKPENITIHIESKEDFDAKYKSSWFNYFR